MDDRPSIGFPFQDFWINPRTNWARFFNPQIFVSLNDGDADVENHVLSRAGSYGKQLGCILDVLDVLVARVLGTDGLTPAERLALDRFHELTRTVDAAVADYRGPRGADATSADVDRVLGGLRDLARTDRAAYRRLANRLRDGLDKDVT